MAEQKVAPCGSWKSPITSELIASGTIGLGQIELDGDNVYWIEMRPAEQGRNAVGAVVDAFGRLDVLVNNAGISIWGAAEEMPHEDWLKVLDVNLRGVFLCAQAAGRVVLEQGSGLIINVASMSGTIVNIPQRQANYNSSKAAVVHLPLICRRGAGDALGNVNASRRSFSHVSPLDEPTAGQRAVQR